MNTIDLATIRTYVKKLEQKGYSSETIVRKLNASLEYLRWAYHNDVLGYSQFQQIKDEIANYVHTYGGPLIGAGTSGAEITPSNLQETAGTSDMSKNQVHSTAKKLKSWANGILRHVPLLGIGKTPKNARGEQDPQNTYANSGFELGPQHYVGLAFVLMIMAILGAGIYQRFFLKTSNIFAYPSTPTSSSRILSFQGRLTDSLGNPINTATNMRFRLYTASSGGSTLYDSGTCSISPDQDGVHNVLIGSDCGAEVANSVFTENTQVWLGVTVGSDSEMTPRQRIANVPYAINAETLQGLPVGTNASNIPYINSGGDLLIAASSPQIGSNYSSETFLLSSANAITIQSAGSGDVTLTATGSGTIKFLTGGSQAGYFDNDGNLIMSNGNQIQLGNLASNPTAVGAGSLYYNTTDNKVYFYNGTSWTEVGSGSGAQYWQVNAAALSPSISTYDVLVGSTATASALVRLPGISGQNGFFNSGGAFGVGTTGPDRKLDVLDASNPQLRLTQADGSVYTDFQTDSSGNLTVTTTGSSVTFSGDTVSASDFSCTDCLDFAEFEDTLDLDAALVLNQGTNIWTQNFTGTTTTGYTYNADSLTTGIASLTSIDALTTGTGISVSSTSTALSTSVLGGSLMTLDWTPGSSTTAATDLFRINIGPNGNVTNLLNITDNGTSVFRVSEAQIESAAPHLFSAAGDVNIAYDLLFSNQTAAYIKSLGPLQLEAGEAAESNPLTLKTYNSGNIVLDAGNSTTATGTVNFYDSNIKGASTTTAIPFANASADINTFRTNFTDETIIDALNETFSAATGGGAGSVWTDSGTNIYLTTTTDEVIIGGTTALSSAKLSIDGDADQIQFLVQGNATQTTDLVVFETSAGTDVFNLSNAGNLDAAGTLTSGTGNAFTVDATGNISTSGTTGLTFSSTGGINLTGGTISDATDEVDINDSLAVSSILQVGSTSATTYSRFGTNATGHSLSGADAVLVSGALEVDGILYADNGITATGTVSATDFTCTDCLDFAEFEDTLDLDAALILNQGTNTWTQNFTGTTTIGLSYVADSLTTGGAIDISVDGLTSGKGLYVSSTSTALTSGNLASLDWTPGSSTTATGDLFKINIGPNGNVSNLLNITDNGTSVFRVSESQIESAVPHTFSAAGDTSLAYDLLFSNQTASYIKTNAPFTIDVGEAWESNDLTLKTYNSGDVIIDAGGSTTATGTVKFYDSNIKGATITTAIPFAAASADVNTFRTNYTNENIIGAFNEIYSVATGGGAGSVWTDSGTNIYLTSTTDELIIGGTTALSSAKVSIDGDADQIQLIVQGNGTQTTSLAVFENSAGTDQLTVSNSGDLAIEGALSDISGNLTINDSVDVTGNILPTTDDTYTLGSDTKRWKDIFLGPETIHIGTSTSDEATIGYTTSSNTFTFTNNFGDTDFSSSTDGFNFTLGGGAGDDFIVDTTTLVVESDNDRVGIGTVAPAAKLDSLATTEQLRLSYDVSNYLSFTVGSSGDLTLDATGGDINFANNDVLNIGGSGTDAAYNGIGDTFAGASGNVDSDDDLYIEGNLEVDGTIYGNVSGTINPGFTQGSVVFTGPSGELAQDNANFFWDDSANKLGIGNAAPVGKFDLSGAVTGKALAILNETGNQDILTASVSGTTRFRLANDGGFYAGYLVDISNTNYGIDPAGTSNFGGYSLKVTGGALLAADSGNVGIGNQTPVGKLDVAGAVTGKALTILNETGDQNILVASASGVTQATLSRTGDLTLVGDLAVNGDDITSDGTLTLDAVTDIVLDADGADIFFKDAGTTFATFTNSSTDLTLDIAGGDLFFADGDVFNIGGSGTDVAYSAIGDSLAGAANVNSDNDLYIEDDLEVDGTIFGNIVGTITPGFTQGSVIFTGASGELAQDNASFFFNDTTNRLGLGDTTPDAFLDITGTTEQLRLSYETGDTNYASFTLSSGGNLTIAPTGATTNITGDLDVSDQFAAGANGAITANHTANIANNAVPVDTSGSYGIYHTQVTTGSGSSSAGHIGIYNYLADNSSSTGNLGMTSLQSDLYMQNGSVGGNSTWKNIYGFLKNESSGGTHNGALYNFFASAQNAGTKVWTSEFNFYSAFTNTGTATTTSLYNFYAATPTNASGTLTNAYGLRVDDQSVGTNTNAYGVYIAAQAGGSGDNVGLYVADAEDYSIQLASTDGDAASGITFGTDTNLYRNGANQLHTDDSFDIDGNLIIDGNTTLGNASGDTVTANADAWTFVNDTNFALSGGINGLSFDTSTFSVDATNDRIGIGTTSPDGKLQVTGASTGKALTILNETGNQAILTASAGGVTRLTLANDGSIAQTTTATTGTGYALTANSITTGYGISESLNGLTTGTGLYLSSTSTALGTSVLGGSLGYLDWSPGSTTTAATDLFRINIGANGNVTNLLNITDNGTSVFRVSEAQIESAAPHLFSAAGDVNIAYDLLFSNQTAAYIKSLGPLQVEAGEAAESNPLTLKTYNSGNIVLDAGNSTSATGTVSFYDSNIKGASVTTAIPFAAASSDVNTFRTNYTNENIIGALNEVYTAATGGAGSVWTDSGTNVYLTSTTDEVVIGGTTALSSAKLSIDGDADQIQFLVQGNATQTTSLMVLENSGGTDQMTVSNTGDVAVEGALSDISGNLVFNDAVDIGSASTGLNVTTAGAVSDIDGNIVLNDVVDIGSATTGLNVTTAGLLSDIDGNVVIGDTIDLGSASTGLNITTAGAVSDIDGNIVLNDVVDIGSASTGLNVTTAGLLSDIDGNVVIGDTVDLGSASTGVNVTTAGALSDSDGNLVLNDTVDIGSASTGLNITTAGLLSDIDGNVVIGDTIDLGSASTGLNVTTAGALSDIDGNISLNDNVDVTGKQTITLTTAGTNVDALNISANQTAASGGTLRGINLSADFSGTSGTQTGVNGLDFTVKASGNGGTVTTMKGISAWGVISTGATVSTLKLFDAANPSNSGTITSLVGNDIAEMSSGANNTNLLVGTTTSAAGNWSIYNSSTYTNYFGATTGIGTTGPDAKLDVLATTEQLRLTYADGSAYTAFTTSSGGDLTIDPSGGQVLLADTDTLNVGGVSALAYNAISDSGGATSHSLASDDDLFVEGDVEVDGTLFADGAITAAGTITGGDFACTDCLDFAELEDTLDLDAALVLNQGTNIWTQNFTGTTTTGYTYNANSLTTGIASSTAINALTTGTGVSISSTSTALATSVLGGSLANFDWTPGSSTTAATDLFRINIGPNGNVTNLLNITDNGTSVFRVGESQIESAVPHTFSAAGDTSLAYDLLFSNQTASYIKSNAPLTIDVGESWESNDLTLKTYNSGDLVLDLAGGVTFAQAQAWDLANSSTTSLNIESGLLDLDTTNTRVGVNTTGPDAKLDVLGTTEQLRLTYTDGSVYTSMTTDSGGDLTIAPSGADASLTGNFLPTTDDTYNLGSDTKRWKDAYLGAETAHIGTSTSDEGTLSYTTSTNVFNINGTGDLAIDMSGDDVTTPDRVTVGSATAGVGKFTVTGAETGKALTILNETGNQNILVASKSGTGMFAIGNSGDLSQLAGHGTNALPDQGSMAPNGGFEVDNDGNSLPDGWTSGAGTISVSTGTVRQGLNALELDASESGLSSCFPVTGGQVYSVSGWAISSLLLTHNFRFIMDGFASRSNCESNTSGTPQATSLVASTSGWASKTGNLTMQTTDRWARARILENSASNGLFIDSFRITPSSLTTGLDLAETYPANLSEKITMGQIVAFGSGAKQNGADVKNITRSENAYDRNVFGVVATQPGIVLDDAHSYSKVQVALKGRVPVLVTTENGPIKIGDPITASSIPGVGMKATRSGKIVGYAMTEYSNVDPKAVDQVTVFVNPETYVDLSILTDMQNKVEQFPSTTLAALVTTQKVVSNIIEASSITVHNLVAQTLSATNATIDNLIVDRLSSREVETQKLKAQKIVADNIAAQKVKAEKIETDSIEAKDATISGKLVAQEVDSENIRELRARLEKVALEQSSSPSIDSSELQSEVESIQNYLESLDDADTQDVAQLPLTEMNQAVQVDPGTTESITGDTIHMMNVEKLSVTGEAAMASLVVSDSFTAGGIFIKNDFVLSLNSELKLSALEKVSILDGAVVIAKDGTIRAKGEVIAEKGVRADTLKALDAGKAVGIDLKNNSVAVTNNDQVVAEINASGSAKFRDVSVDTYTEATNSAAVITAADNYEENGILSPAIQTNAAAAGNGLLPAYNNNIVIFNDKINDHSLIYITPTSKTFNQNLYVAEKHACTPLQVQEDGCKPYFSVHIDGAVKNNIGFNWWVVN